MNKQELEQLLPTLPDDAARISVGYVWTIEWGTQHIMAFNSSVGRVPDGWSLVHPNDQPAPPMRRFYRRVQLEKGERNGKA